MQLSQRLEGLKRTLLKINNNKIMAGLQWNNDKDFGYSFEWPSSTTPSTTTLENINNNNNKKSMLKRIPDTLKRVLNKELRAQYRADLIKTDLSLTERGKEALMEILAVKYQEELAKKANEIIRENEEENN